MSGLIVTVEHMRTVPGLGPTPGYCVKSSRAWFRRHGLDWRRFVREGIDAEQLLATGDALAARVVEHARKLADGR